MKWLRRPDLARGAQFVDPCIKWTATEGEACDLTKSIKNIFDKKKFGCATERRDLLSHISNLSLNFSIVWMYLIVGRSAAWERKWKDTNRSMDSALWSNYFGPENDKRSFYFYSWDQYRKITNIKDKLIFLPEW